MERSAPNGIWIGAIVPYADPGGVFPAQAADAFFARNPGSDVGRLTECEPPVMVAFHRERVLQNEGALMARVRRRAIAEYGDRMAEREDAQRDAPTIGETWRLAVA